MSLFQKTSPCKGLGWGCRGRRDARVSLCPPHPNLPPRREEGVKKDVSRDIDSVPWILFELVRSREHDSGRQAQAVKAGRRLAEFHTVASAFDEEERKCTIEPTW